MWPHYQTTSKNPKNISSLLQKFICETFQMLQNINCRDKIAVHISLVS